jgi:hypothetical protein
MKAYINMKQIAAGMRFLCLLVGLGACNDFLEEEPRSSFVTNQYFSDPEHAYAAVNALYRRGFPELYNAGGAYAGPNIMLGGYISGLFDNEYSGQELYVKLCQELDITPQNAVGSRMGDIWDPCYNAIARANTAIKYTPETPGLNDADKTYLLAQAKFFRALNYFHLVKFFGDVPLLLEPTESTEDNMYAKREAAEKVYEQIEKDLKAAAEGLKDAAFTDEFRVTKHTANALLASVYLQWSGFPLQNNRYADAAAVARAVISGGKHSLETNGATPDLSAYNALRTNDKSPEIVYAVEYNASIADGGWWPSYSATGAVEGYKEPGSKESYYKFDIMKNVYAIGDTTSVIYNAYLSGDKRIASKEGFFYKLTYVGKTADGKGDSTITVKNICNWFYYEEGAMLKGTKPDKDKPVIRYAEVLLTAAEAIAQSEGVTQEAVEYLKAVRERAGVDVSTLTTSLSKDDFIKEVWAERLREFPLEFKVWDDIQRTRKYPQTSAASPGAITWVDIIGAQNPQGATFQEKFLLWPIPANEIQRNPSLLQSGY